MEKNIECWTMSRKGEVVAHPFPAVLSVAVAATVEDALCTLILHLIFIYTIIFRWGWLEPALSLSH
jgi:hypothetical protein